MTESTPLLRESISISCDEPSHLEENGSNNNNYKRNKRKRRRRRRRRRSRADDDDDDDDDDYKTKKEENEENLYRSEFNHLINLAYHMIIIYLLEFGPGIVTVVIVGHAIGGGKSSDGSDGNDESSSSNDQIYLDAAALAVMFVNLTGFSIGIGLATALDTLASQAFGSSVKEEEEEAKKNAKNIDIDDYIEKQQRQKPKNTTNNNDNDNDTVATTPLLASASSRNRLCLYFQTGLLVLTLACIPVFIISFNSARILKFLGQPQDVSDLCGQFINCMIPGIPFVYLYELYRKILQAQNIVKPLVYVALVSNIVNIVLGYILVFHSPFGWLGAAIARTCCNVSMPLLLLPYLIYSGLIDTFWTGWQPISLVVNGMHSFLELGIPGMLMLCFEWWAFEFLTLLSGMLYNAYIAMGANALLTSIGTTSYMIYLGLSISGNIRVGNALGADDPERARVVSNLTIGVSAISASVMACVLLLCRKTIPKFYTSDEDINSLVSELMYIVAAFQLFDAIQAAIQGAFRGSGRQALGAKLTFLTYYGVGLPLGIILAFHFGLGLTGLWIGMTAGLCFISLVALVIICRTDWYALANDAINRLS